MMNVTVGYGINLKYEEHSHNNYVIYYLIELHRPQVSYGILLGIELNFRSVFKFRRNYSTILNYINRNNLINDKCML